MDQNRETLKLLKVFTSGGVSVSFQGADGALPSRGLLKQFGVFPPVPGRGMY